MLVWTTVSKRYMDLPHRFKQPQVCEAVGLALVDLLKPLAYRCKVAILRLSAPLNLLG